METQLIIIRGTPGAGKSSLARRLKKAFVNGAMIEVDNVRGMLNNVNWKDEKEHLIALDAVAVNSKSFLDAGIAPVIVVDMFLPDQLEYFLSNLPGVSYKVISLLVNGDVHRKRLTDRKEGFKDIEKGILLNESIRNNSCLHEMIIETSGLGKNEVLEQVLAGIKK